MRALHVYRTYFPDPPGGLQEAIRQICLATRACGVENTVFTLSPNSEPVVIERPEGRVVRARSWAAPASCDLGGISAFALFRRLASLSDVVVYHFPWPFADVLNLALPRAVPAVMVYHSDIVRQRWLGRAYRPLMARTLRSMKAVVATSPAYARTSLVLAAEDVRERVRVIPLGIDASSYPPGDDAAYLEGLGLGEGKTFFLFLGVLRYYKGLHDLLAAAQGLDAQVVIAGSGPENVALQAQAAQLGLHNVVFAGQVSEGQKVTLLKHCRALVLPSHLRSEAFGMVLVEAAMFGRPMISCEIGTGTSFVNLDGETGIVVPPGNPDVLRAAMQDLARDAVRAGRLGEAARARYQQLFSGPALGRAYTGLFAEVTRRCS